MTLKDKLYKEINMIENRYDLVNKEILDIIKKSADRYNSPELPYGWGIPDMKKAMEIANSYKK